MNGNNQKRGKVRGDDENVEKCFRNQHFKFESLNHQSDPEKEN